MRGYQSEYSSEIRELLEKAALYEKEDSLTKEMADTFLEAVYIQEGGACEIVWKRGEELQKLLQLPHPAA